MGDCNIRISLTDSLIFEIAKESASDPAQKQTLLRLASDATVADMLEVRILNETISVLEILQKKGAKLWDCTFYPAKDITDIVLHQFPEKQGPRSLTLFDAGWFVSGTLFVAKENEGPPRRNVDYDDVQYNARSTLGSTVESTSGAPAVRLKNQSGGGASMMPSQVLQSVSSRFEGVDVPETDAVVADAKALRRATAEKAREREAARQRKLSFRIQKLDQNKGGVANQVQKMLIKSRAVGRANLQESDRIYLRVMVDAGVDQEEEEDDNSAASPREDFFYFSLQDVIGKVLSQFLRQTNQKAEFLVRALVDDTVEYRRLSNLMRFQEAVDAGCVASFDRVVVRLYDPTQDEPTSTFPVVESTSKPAPNVNSQDQHIAADTIESATKTERMDTGDEQQADLFEDEALSAALAGLEKSTKKTTKSSSSTVSKVRQMQIKSKAKGDTKRIKMPDRFFIEVVVAEQTSDGSVRIPGEATSPFFLSAKDPLQRLLKDGWVKAPMETTRFLTVATTMGSKTDAVKFRAIPDPSTSLQQLASDGILTMFDRLIVYY